MNEYLFRLALVVNTSHSKFIDNLTNIIVYALYVSNLEKKEIHICELKNTIEELSGLEFTEKEIKQALTGRESYFCITDKEILGLTEEGNKKIHAEKAKEFERILSKYIEVYDINRKPDEIKSLIYKFLYDCMENNIESLLKVVTGAEKTKSLSPLEQLSNEDRKIINDFIDWNDESKNVLLYDIVSFAVDYCQLTVKKNKSNFSTILQGKRFYLDTNIIFRMMGLNNEQRKETTLRFINKCKEAKIKLCMTSLTKIETLNSIQYHVGQVKKIMQGYCGNGKALSKLYEKSDYEDGFLTVYLSWSNNNGVTAHYDEFSQYLKKYFYEITNGIDIVDVGKISLNESLLDDYIDSKDGKITKENAEYDVKNLLYVNKKRKLSSDTIGWNVEEYLISADHKLIRWSNNNFSKENPLVVLPSVWYSIILKVQGRAKDDIKAFSEFIKIRYIQDKPAENINYLINSVCQKTSNGVLQDMLFDQIAEDNDRINELSFSNDQKIDEIVKEVYEDILESTKQEGYFSGEKAGHQKGFNQGVSQGEKIGRIKTEIEHLQSETSIKSLKIRNRNITITIIITVIVFALCLMFLNKCPVEYLNNIKIAGKIIISLVPSGIVGRVLWAVFPLGIEEIKELENEKIQPKIDELKRELKIYE